MISVQRVDHTMSVSKVISGILISMIMTLSSNNIQDGLGMWSIEITKQGRIEYEKHRLIQSRSSASHYSHALWKWRMFQKAQAAGTWNLLTLGYSRRVKRLHDDSTCETTESVEIAIDRSYWGHTRAPDYPEARSRIRMIQNGVFVSRQRLGRSRS